MEKRGEDLCKKESSGLREECKQVRRPHVMVVMPNAMKERPCLRPPTPQPLQGFESQTSGVKYSLVDRGFSGAVV